MMNYNWGYAYANGFVALVESLRPYIRHVTLCEHVPSSQFPNLETHPITSNPHLLSSQVKPLPFSRCRAKDFWNFNVFLKILLSFYTFRILPSLSRLFFFFAGSCSHYVGTVKGLKRDDGQGCHLLENLFKQISLSVPLGMKTSFPYQNIQWSHCIGRMWPPR